MGLTYHRWEVSEKELSGMDVVKARDLIIKCFFEAQKESIARGKKALDKEVTDASIMESVRTTVQMAFDETGGSFNKPDLGSLNKVVELLAKKAKAWGTPNDVIEHHKIQMGKIFQKLA
jgi:hypothetical protein